MGLLSSVAKVAAPIASSALSFLGGERANEARMDAYRKQYQWMVQDMRKAGLNPILAAQLGRTGALPAIQNTMAPAVSAGWSAVGQQAEAELAGAQTEHTAADVGRVQAEEARIEASTQKINEEIQLVRGQIGLTQAETERAEEAAALMVAQYMSEFERIRLLSAQGRHEDAKARVESIMADFYEEHPWILQAERTGATGAVTSAVKAGIFGWLFNRGRGGAKK